MTHLYNDLLSTLTHDAPVRDLRVCIRATAVLSERPGLAYTFPRIHKGHEAERLRGRKSLQGLTARELAQLLKSDDPIQASVGLAAFNSLASHEGLNPKPGKAMELILARGEGKDVTVVGHFPFVDELATRVRNLWVLELSPKGEDLPAEEAVNVIPKSDVVAITGTSVINHTIEPLLELARDAFTIILGPSTPLSPVLFDHHVDAISGSIVTDPETAITHVSEGSSFRYIEGIQPVNVVRSWSLLG